VSIFDRVLGGPHPAAVRAELVALKEPERRKRAKEAAQEFEKAGWHDGRGRAPQRWQAAALAWAGTATARQLTSGFWRIGWELRANRGFADDVYAVCAARGAAFFGTLARGVLEAEGSGGWPLVRRGVREGLIEVPDTEEYVRCLVVDVSYDENAFRELDSTYRGLLDDPGLLERDVWRIFEVDVGAELGNANTWEPKSDGKAWEGWTRGDNRWLHALTRLADEGRLDRQRLLDASLDALMRDFRATTVGWYARLHEELEPTREERLARLDRYLALVTSPAPAVVKAGLSVLRELEDDVPAEGFARVAPTPFTQRQKNLSTETLSMLARLAKKHPDARAALLEAAMPALAHERADVQERALKLVEAYPDEAPRAAMLGYLDVVSPTLRSRLEALTGFSAGEERAEVEIRAPAQPRLSRELVLDACAPIEAVGSVDELIELAAMLIEGQGSGDDCERFLDGVSRLCDERPEGFERRTAGLVKRADDTAGFWGAGQIGAGAIASVVHAWTGHRHAKAGGSSDTVFAFLAGRAHEVAKRASRGNARPLLAFPTASGGWIEPAALEARERSTGRILNRPDSFDRLQAQLRAFPSLGPISYERRAHTATRWSRTNRGLRLVASSVPGELGDLATAVEAGGAVVSEDDLWFSVAAGWGGFDPLGVRWALTVLPSLPEVAFAGAAFGAVEAREGSAYHHPEVVLEHALQPHVPLGPEAWLATAACLVAKSPDLTRAGADLLVASMEDGRFDADALGDAIAWLVDEDFAKVNRLAAPLRDVARVSPLHGAQVVRTVAAALARLGTRPHGLHAILEVAVESSVGTGQPFSDERARATLTEIVAEASASSKLGKLARSLLSR
jgi:hypothetical protein